MMAEANVTHLAAPSNPSHATRVDLLPQSVAGAATVPLNALRARLKETAYWTLRKLWSVRSWDTGVTHVTVAGLARRAGFTQHTIPATRRALAKLRAAGLIEIRGWTLREVRADRRRGGSAEATEVVEVFERCVRGGLVPGVSVEAMAYVPAATALWLATTPPKGGVREGAGRPRDPASKRQRLRIAKLRVLRARLPQEGELVILPHAHDLADYADAGLLQEALRAWRWPAPADIGAWSVDAVEGWFRARQAEARGPTKHDWRTPEDLVETIRENASIINPDQVAHIQRPTTDPLSPISFSSSSLDPKGCAGSEDRGALNSPSGSDGIKELDDPTEPIGTKVWVPPQPIPKGIMPTHPGIAIQPARVRRPPQLPEGLPGLTRAHMLAQAYRGAVQARYGKASHALRNGIDKSKFRAALEKAALDLIEEGIAPMAWAAWSIDQWRELRGSRCPPPPVNWVFSPLRIAKHGGWHRSEVEGRYAGGRALIGQVALEVLRIWVAGEHALRHRGAEAADVVGVRFFGPEYQALVRHAQREAKALRDEIEHRIARGEYVWD